MSDNFKEKKINPITQNRNKSNLFLKIFTIFIILLGITSFYFYNGYCNFKNNSLINTETIIEIDKGETPLIIAQKLNLNKRYLKLYLKNEAPDFELLAGKFKIEAGANIETIIKNLKEPIIEGEIDITILEGWNIYDIDNFLTTKGLIEENEYINYVKNPEKIIALTKFFPFIEGLETLEGYLYPDTYKVKANPLKINEFVIKQLENFENKAYKTIFTELSNKQINQVVNLASIVEKEEKNGEEKSTVAGILKKRLNNGWMIGADITVCYPHQLTAEECKMVISKYINEKSDYNTRTMQGLPKTPIGNPSYETIEATLNSKDTQYWFYLHDIQTGKIYYGKTNTEHEQNKRLYLR